MPAPPGQTFWQGLLDRALGRGRGVARDQAEAFAREERTKMLQAELILDAEWQIKEANPPRKGGRGKTLGTDPNVSAEVIRETRRTFPPGQAFWQGLLDRALGRDRGAARDQAAAILERREIQVEAGILVQEAERAIAKSNPPAPPGRGKKVDPGSTISRPVRQKIRQAHAPITDPEFDAVKEQAREQA